MLQFQHATLEYAKMECEQRVREAERFRWVQAARLGARPRAAAPTERRFFFFRRAVIRAGEA